MKINIILGFTKEPLEGAESSINAAINPSFKGVKDIYYESCKASSPSSAARLVCIIIFKRRGRRDRMVVGFITTCAISAYHH